MNAVQQVFVKVTKTKALKLHSYMYMYYFRYFNLSEKLFKQNLSVMYLQVNKERIKQTNVRTFLESLSFRWLSLVIEQLNKSHLFLTSGNVAVKYIPHKSHTLYNEMEELSGKVWICMRECLFKY